MFELLLYGSVLNGAFLVPCRFFKPCAAMAAISCSTFKNVMYLCTIQIFSQPAKELAKLFPYGLVGL